MTVYDTDGWHQLPDTDGMPEVAEPPVCPCQGQPQPHPFSCSCSRLAEIDPAYLPGLLRRLTPFERWVLAELYGHQHELADPVWRVRTVDEIAEDSGLPASRITEIAAAAVERMRGHGLAAD